MILKGKSINLKKYAIQFMQILLGTAIMAISTQFFLLPNKISVGGFAGIATVTYYLLNLPLGIVVLCLNIPLFIIVLLKSGKRFFINAIFGTIFLSIFLDIFARINIEVNDILLGCIYGGILAGIGTAIILKANASTGGTELLAHIIKIYKPGIKVSSLIVMLDISIISLNVIVFKEIEVALYSGLSIYLMGKILDIFFEGIDFSKMIFIISNKHDEISKEVNIELNRGVTALYGKGMYKQEEKLILLCVVSQKEVVKVRKIVNNIDKRCIHNNI